MNLADYLSELLGQYDEVSVPGLGYFVREHINGYYNDKEAKFYPPYHQVKFIQEQKDDDTFTQYVADKKNISLASSKYFAEKFISKLREEAATGKYPFADLGYFQSGADEKLVFKPQDRMEDDPAFYGYPSINIYKLAPPASGGDIKHMYSEPVSAPVVIPPPVQVVEKQQFFEEETDRKKGTNIWLILLVSLSVTALGIFGVYKFFPQAIDNLSTAYHKLGSKKEDTVAPVYRHETKTADTIKKVITPAVVPAKDTTTKAAAVAPPVAAPVVTTPPVTTTTATVQTHFYVILKDKYKKLADATYQVKHLKAKGVDARVLPKTEAPGPYFKVSFKICNTQSEANAAMLALVNEGKINKDLEILPINTQK